MIDTATAYRDMGVTRFTSAAAILANARKVAARRAARSPFKSAPLSPLVFEKPFGRIYARKIGPVRPAPDAAVMPLVSGPVPIKFPEIVREVCEQFGLSKDALLSKSKSNSIVRPRWVVMYLAKTLLKRSYPDIGERLGGKDHTTVLHGVREMEKMIATDETMARHVEAIRRRLA